VLKFSKTGSFLQSRMSKYLFDYRTVMSVDLVSEMLSRNLYYNRFFPLITGAVLAGIAEDGLFYFDYLFYFHNFIYRNWRRVQLRSSRLYRTSTVQRIRHSIVND
jgi:hypothetical protein